MYMNVYKNVEVPLECNACIHSLLFGKVLKHKPCIRMKLNLGLSSDLNVENVCVYKEFPPKHHSSHSSE